jgi:hypothetical protein
MNLIRECSGHSFLSPTSRASKSVLLVRRCLCRFTFGHIDVCELSSALPKLRTLHLGGNPCDLVSASVTFATLAVISKHCKHLESLRIHFNPIDVAGLSSDEELSMPFDDSGVRMRSECALKTLGVGGIRVFGEKGLFAWDMALALLEIFPSLSVIEHTPSNEIWPEVTRRLQRCKAIKRYIGDM